MLSSLLLAFVFLSTAFAASRTEPPSGSIIVRAGTSSQAADEFATLSEAIDSLDDESEASIFIYPGTYDEQVYITRTGPLTIYGYTEDTSSYVANEVLLTAGVDAGSAGSNDASGTLRVHKDNFSLYNVDVENSFGEGSQAIAISQYGSRVGLYGCGFYGFQDTLYANEGTQVYLKGYIEGATDFIFGRHGSAYFGGNTIGVVSNGWVTASGREEDDDGSYVFESNTIILASGADGDVAGNTFLGRPWGAYAKVIFKNTVVNVELDPAIWSVWHDDDPRTDNILFAEYNTSGEGVEGAERPDFVTILSESEAAQYTIASAVGDDYADWVDAEYLV